MLPPSRSDAVGPLVSSVTVSLFEENCYIVADPTTKAAAIVDPGDEGDRIIRAVRATGANVEAVWLTHAHLDHIGALADVTRAWDVPVYLHPLDLPVFRYAPNAAELYGLPWTEQPLPSHEFAEAQLLTLGALRFTVMHAPGHAPGHVVIHGHGIALAGDCLFLGSVGRTDLPLSDPRALTRSLARIAALPPTTVVYPGHGPSTTIDRELRSNPFLNGGARVLGG
jgi:hydroxyacylglutathione hydrolase